MKTIQHILAAVLSLLMVGGCNTIHEFPVEAPVDSTTVRVDVKLAIQDVEFEIANLTKSLPLSNDAYDIRCIVEAYPDGGTKGESSPVLRKVITGAIEDLKEFDISLDLDVQKYNLLFWVDYVLAGTYTDLHYETQSLMAVKIMRPYKGSDGSKDAFTSVKNIDLTTYRDQDGATVSVVINLKRPFAKIEIITTDIQKFVSSKIESQSEPHSLPSKVVFRYLPSIGEQYNVLYQKPERFSNGETFTCQTSSHSDTECVLAYDYLFMNGATTNASVSFDIYDQNDKLLNRVENILIPIKRNSHTIVRGEFLIKDFKGGGVGIEDGFDSEIIITIPD